MFNHYAILQVSTNRISTIEVDYLKEVPNTEARSLWAQYVFYARIILIGLWNRGELE